MLFDNPLGVKITGLTASRAVWLVATCKGSALRLPDVSEFDYDEQETAPGNYHLMDYPLFYMDIQLNARARLRRVPHSGAGLNSKLSPLMQ